MIIHLNSIGDNFKEVKAILKELQILFFASFCSVRFYIKPGNVTKIKLVTKI